MSKVNVRSEFKTLMILVGLCLLLRLCAAYFVFGPQALDDYLNTLLRVKHWLQGQDLELAPWRSPLIVWMLGGAVKGVEFFTGVLAPVTRIRVIYSFLALFSMVGIVGAWLYYRPASESRARFWAILFVGFHGFLPFISTRALGEAMALPLFVLGVGFCEAADQKNKSFVFYGFAALGLATLLRFQCGVFYVPFALMYLWRKRWALGPLMGASFLILMLQSAIDLAVDRYPLETVFNYLLKNQDTTSYSVQPWWSTWATWALFLWMPLSLVFFSHWKKFWRRHSGVIVPTFIFLTLHSCVPHKEERFIYPVLGLGLILMAWFWGQKPYAEWLLRRKTTFIFMIALNAVVVVLATFENTQIGVVEPLAEVSRTYKNVRLLDWDSPMGDSKIWTLFFSAPSELVKVRRLTPDTLENIFAGSSAPEAVVITTSVPAHSRDIERLSRERYQGFRCSNPHHATSWTDQMVYKLNPRRNARRRPTTWLLCSRAS